MTEYTPTTDAIRDTWGISVSSDKRPERLAEFDRWLNQVKAEAWDEGYEQLEYPIHNPYRKGQ